jgi:hypothetical protein
LASSVLVEAGGFESGPGEQIGEGVEEQQVGFEPADFVNDLTASASLAVEELAAGPVSDGGSVAFGAAADVNADNAAVDPVGAGVIGAAIGAGFPGHGG